MRNVYEQILIGAGILVKFLLEASLSAVEDAGTWLRRNPVQLLYAIVFLAVLAALTGCETNFVPNERVMCTYGNETLTWTARNDVTALQYGFKFIDDRSGVTIIVSGECLVITH